MIIVTCSIKVHALQSPSEWWLERSFTLQTASPTCILSVAERIHIIFDMDVSLDKAINPHSYDIGL